MDEHLSTVIRQANQSTDEPTGERLDGLSPLCKKCRAIFDEAPSAPPQDEQTSVGEKSSSSRKEMHDVNQTTIELELSRQSCHLCYLRWTSWHDVLQTFEDAKVVYSLDPENQDDRSLWMAITEPLSRVYLFLINYTIRDYHEALPTLTTSTGSSATFAELLRWMRCCDSDHRICSKRTSYLPYRLIDLGHLANQKIRLCYGSDVMEECCPPYVALSYCWGICQQPCLLTRANLSSMLDEIDHSTLPLLHQDVIKLLRFLNLRYLWIDSLCIIQDDENDWIEQSADMCNIYENCYLNIIATRVENCSQSLFTSHPDFTARPCLVKSTSSSPGNVAGRKFLEVLDTGNWHKTLAGLPVMKRAWCLQERILAPRIVYFTNTQILWNCRRSKLSQVSPKRPGDNAYTPEGPTRSGYFGNQLLPNLHKVTGVRRYRAWWDIVEEYSGCDLTFPDKDKLAAISGMAQKFGLDHEYVAGHWLSDAMSFLGLSWETNNVSVRNVSDRNNGRALSWSWASINGQVSAHWTLSDRASLPLADLLAIDGLATGFRSAQQQTETGGHLVLAACLVRFTLLDRVLSDSLFSGYTDASNDWTIKGCDPGLIVGLALDLSTVTPATQVIAAIIEQTSYFNSENDTILHLGLILEHLGPRGEFRRIGLLSCEQTPHEPGRPQQDIAESGLRDWMTLMTEDLPEELYVSRESRCDARFEDAFARKSQEQFPLWFHTIKLF